MKNEKDNATGTDVDALVQFVLREVYREATEDLRAYAEKVRELNKRKQALRGYLAALRKFKADVLSAARERAVDLCLPSEKDLTVLAELFEGYATAHDVGDVEYELCVPDRVPPATVKSVDSLADEITRWEERLNGVGDDAQLANIDLQNALQKQQQTLQMLSNISKLLYDTALGIIRHIGG